MVCMTCKHPLHGEEPPMDRRPEDKPVAPCPGCAACARRSAAATK